MYSYGICSLAFIYFATYFGAFFECDICSVLAVHMPAFTADSQSFFVVTNEDEEDLFMELEDGGELVRMKQMLEKICSHAALATALIQYSGTTFISLHVLFEAASVPGNTVRSAFTTFSI